MKINELPICAASMIRVEKYRHEEQNITLFEGYFDNLPNSLGKLEVRSMHAGNDSMIKTFNVIVILVK